MYETIDQNNDNDGAPDKTSDIVGPLCSTPHMTHTVRKDTGPVVVGCHKVKSSEDNTQNWREIVILLTNRSLSSGANNVSHHCARVPSSCPHTTDTQNWRAIVILLTDRSLSSGANNVSHHCAAALQRSVCTYERITPERARTNK